MNIFEEVSAHLHLDHHQETPVTAAPALPPGTFAKTAWQAVHRDAQFLEHGLASLGDAVSHILPLAARIVANPDIDELVELVLKAGGLGVGPEAFAAAAAVLRDAMARQAATAPVPHDDGTVPPLAGENPSPVITPDHAPESASDSEHADGNGIPQEAEAQA